MLNDICALQPLSPVLAYREISIPEGITHNGHFTEYPSRILLVFSLGMIIHRMYKPVIRPTTLFTYSAYTILVEFTPSYELYYNHIRTCYMMLKDYTDNTKGASFHSQLKAAFDKDYDFEVSAYGDLEVAAGFSDSVYTLMDAAELNTLAPPGKMLRISTLI